MSLLKRHAGRRRHVGRRVAGVAVGVALMVIGLQAPAFAAPAISGISPTSGPDDCVVVITGTGFDQPGAFAIDEVNFTGAGGINTEAALFHVVSDTEIWTTVPAAATTGAITVVDTDPSPDATANSPVFTITTNAGDCGPTIASFTPTCGVVGTVVTITGTNLLDTSGDDSTTTDPTGGDVRFNPYGATAGTGRASHTGAAESPTTLVVNVPSGAVDGPIRVDTDLGAGDDNVDSTESFNVVTDPTECGVTPPPEHSRNVTLKLSGSLRMKGKVNATDDFTACESGVSVKLQKKKKGGGWKTLKTVTTNDTGGYSSRVKDKPGRYRSVAPRTTVGEDICLKDVSPVRKN